MARIGEIDSEISALDQEIRYLNGRRRMLVDEKILIIEGDVADIENVYLSFSDRALRLLKIAGVRTIGDAKRKTDAQLMSVEGLGVKTLKEIRGTLNHYSEWRARTLGALWLGRE